LSNDSKLPVGRARLETNRILIGRVVPYETKLEDARSERRQEKEWKSMQLAWREEVKGNCDRIRENG
jgi:hypothetical protein